MLAQAFSLPPIPLSYTSDPLIKKMVSVFSYVKVMQWNILSCYLHMQSIQQSIYVYNAQCTYSIIRNKVQHFQVINTVGYFIVLNWCVLEQGIHKRCLLLCFTLWSFNEPHKSILLSYQLELDFGSWCRLCVSFLLNIKQRWGRWGQ